ncbi:MAG: quinol oxidase [Desulfurivibrio sp.]|nr:MAG: quinol oxidase [Desulfurivibrio sp.]
MRIGILALVLLLVGGTLAGGEQIARKRLVATIDADGVQRVAMTGGEYYFDPSEVVVKVNVPVELGVRKSEGMVPHNIALNAPEAGIDFDRELSSSEVTVIRFTPTRVGTYPFACTHRFLFFESHSDKGMHGVLEVVQ